MIFVENYRNAMYENYLITLTCTYTNSLKC